MIVPLAVQRGIMSDRIDRRSFLARGAVAGAGIAVVGTSGGLLAACSSGSGSSSTTGTGTHPDGVSSAAPKQGGQLVFGVDAEEKGFSPTQGTFDEVGILYARTVFDPLMILSASGTPEPYLAQSVTPNSDYTVWTITLRPNLVFHNGSPCDGAAVAANFAAHKASALTGPTLTAVDSVMVTSPLVVTITMKSPWVPFDFYLTGGIGGQFAYVAEPTWLNSNSQTNPVGTGPFVFQEWTPNDHFTATKNPHYWRTGYPYLDSITYKPIPDSDQLLSSLTSGSVDIMHTPTPAVISTLRADTSLAYIDDSKNVAGEPDMDCLQLNLDKPPFNNLKVRQATAYAVSSAQYVEVIDRGVNSPSNGPFPSTSPYYLADNGYPVYNVSKAKALVQQVQQETGQPVAVTIDHLPDSSTTRIAEYLQQQLQTVGMQVTLNPIQQAQEINVALLGSFEAIVWRQFGAVDPDMNYIFWSPTNANTPGFSINMARNTDPAMETALLKGRQSPNQTDRIAAYQEVNKLMGSDLPYIWNDRTLWSVAAQPKVQNFNNPTTPAGGKAFGMIGGAVWPTQIWLTS
jgi:peptide/nickel transport system substrate-binding protein